MPKYTTDPATVGRNLQIDVLRGIAILGVLARHLVLFTKPNRWDALPIRAGWAGVDLFFVLSGFLIGGLLFAEFRRFGGIAFRRFALRRALRIYPAFWLLLALTAAVRFRSGAAQWKPLINDLLFLQSYRAGSWGHFWSLAVEVHFYILLPLVLFLLMQRAKPGQSNPFRALPCIFLLLSLLALGARLITARVVPFSWQTHLFPTHLRIDSLCFGVLLAYCAHFYPMQFASFARKHRVLLACATTLLIAPCFIFGQYDPIMYTFGFTSLYLGFGALLVLMLYLPLGAALRSLPVRALASVGTFSYSIYLWQTPWLMLISKAHLLSSSLFIAGAIAVGIALDKAIEQPVLRLRDRLCPARTATAAVVVAEPTLDLPAHYSRESATIPDRMPVLDPAAERRPMA